jgi:hypothetical protein
VKRVCVLLGLLALAGCGGSATPKPDHATLTDVRVRATTVDFTFDSAPQTVRHAYAERGTLAECGSGAPVRPKGAAFLVVHFQPAQSQGVPKRIVMPSGVVLDVWKVCDFEADVAWAIGLSRRETVAVTRHDRHVILSFG